MEQKTKWALIADATYSMCQGYAHTRQPRPGAVIDLDSKQEGRRVQREIGKEIHRQFGTSSPMFPENVVNYITLSRPRHTEEDWVGG